MSNGPFRPWLLATIKRLSDPMLDDEPQDASGLSRWAVDQAARRAAASGMADVYAARPSGLLWPPDAIAYLSACLAAADEPAAPTAPMTIQATADRYGIPVRTLYKLCAAGLLKHSRVGTGRGRIRIRPVDMDRYLDRAAAPAVRDYVFGG